METKSEIPMFKRSNDSLSRDVLKLKKLEAISEGWYKGQLISLLEKVAGKTIINGVECYNTNIIIDSYTGKSNNSEYAKNIKKLLELLGLEKSALDSIYNTSLSDQVAGIRLNFNKNSGRNRQFSEFDFKQTFESIKKQLENAHRFELVHTNKYYEMTDTARPEVASSDIFTDTVWDRDDDFFNELQEYATICDENGCTDFPIEIIRNFSKAQSMQYTEVKIYNNINEDITSYYPKLLVNALKICLAMSGNKFAELSSITKVSEELYYNSFLERQVYIVKTLENYNNIINNNFKDEYNRYKNGTLKVEETIVDTNDGGGETYIVNGILAMHYWSYYLFLDMLDNDATNDLFYIDKKVYTFRGQTYYDEKNVVRYINVKGLKRENAKTIASSFSQYADFQIIKAKKKTRFLGIGGFVGSFLGGIFNIILQGIQLIAKIMYYIPLVRLGMQAIAWLFSGEWSNDKDRIIATTTRVIIAVISLLIVIATGGGGIEIAISLMTSAYGLYTGLDQFDKMKESLENQKKRDNKKDTNSELYDKIIDLSNGKDEFDARNNALYKPFESINNIYRSPFEKNGLYNPKFG